MNAKVYKFLHLDTLGIEVMSCVAFMAFGISNILMPEKISTPHVGFYIFSILFMGIIYSLPVILRDKVVVVRAILAYLSGVFWVWMGLSSIYTCSHLTLCNIVALTFGIGNIYAFLIHILLLKRIRI
jgi:hypothetical protein